MPAFDQTGPQGMGPLTGRGFGRCGSGLGRNFGFGLRRSFGRGFRRGWGLLRPSWGRFWSQAPQSSQTQTDDLTDYVKSLEQEMKLAKEELARLAKDQGK